MQFIPNLLKSFINEYADELRHTEAWKADPGGEQQKLLDEWTDAYGKDGSLKMYRVRSGEGGGKGGCDKCKNTGYKGRVGIHELMTNSEELTEAINKEVEVADLKRVAMKNGMKTLHQDSMLKVKMGLTTIEEKALGNIQKTGRKCVIDGVLDLARAHGVEVAERRPEPVPQQRLAARRPAAESRPAPGLPPGWLAPPPPPGLSPPGTGSAPPGPPSPLPRV